VRAIPLRLVRAIIAVTRRGDILRIKGRINQRSSGLA
jgi:hypothetical protein